MSNPTNKFKEGSKWLLIVAFVGLLWLPTLDVFFGLDKAPAPNERRKPAEFPKFEASGEGLKRYVTGLEQYFNDHFGFRKRLIRWNNRWKKSWFKDSSMVDVITGKEEWLYFSGGRMIDLYRGTKVLSEEDLQSWQNLLEGRRDWLAERGIQYVFVIPPTKQSVYPEYLPDWLEPGPFTTIDQFVKHMTANTTVEIVDLRGPLIERKGVGPDRVFLHTDSHWNMLGGFFGYQTVIERLQKIFPDMQPLSLDQFEKYYDDKPGGDLATMMGQENTLIERGDISLAPIASLPKFETRVLTNLFNKKWAKYAEPIHTVNPSATRKAVVFRDSFTGNLIPFLGYHFNEIYYIWQYNWNKAFIEEVKPDIVMDIMVEAYFNQTDPREMKVLDEKPEITRASHNQ